MGSLPSKLELLETVAGTIHEPARKRGGDELLLEPLIARAVLVVDRTHFCGRIVGADTTQLGEDGFVLVRSLASRMTAQKEGLRQSQHLFELLVSAPAGSERHQET